MRLMQKIYLLIKKVFYKEKIEAGIENYDSDEKSKFIKLLQIETIENNNNSV